MRAVLVSIGTQHRSSGLSQGAQYFGRYFRTLSQTTIDGPLSGIKNGRPEAGDNCRVPLSTMTSRKVWGCSTRFVGAQRRDGIFREEEGKRLNIK